MQDRIKVVIVDDEPQSIHRLQDDLATLEDFEVIATSSSAVSAKTILSMSPSLAQVRQDCIINLDYLLCIENYTLRCIFSPPFDHEEITVSRRCYKAVKDQLEIL